MAILELHTNGLLISEGCDRQESGKYQLMQLEHCLHFAIDSSVCSFTFSLPLILPFLLECMVYIYIYNVFNCTIILGCLGARYH
jgi:hypothetical protein